MSRTRTSLPLFERELDKLFWTAVRLQHLSNELALCQASDDLAGIMQWSAGWQEKLSSKRPGQRVPAPLPLSQAILPF